MKKLYILALLIFPALLVFTAASLHYARGPYWLHSDPDYLYLFNSLALAELKQSGTTGNPGTTVQILGAAVLKITYAFNASGKDSLEYAVLRNPESYLTVMNVVLVSFNVLLLLILGLAVFHLTKNIWLGLLMQLSPFISNTILLSGLPRISPESLLLFSGLLLALFLIEMVFNKNLSESVCRYTIIFALICGFGAATKLTFIPVLIIPLFVLPKIKNKIVFLFLTALSFVLWTLPVISQYKTLFNWYYKIFTHTGYYGLGPAGLINTETYLQNMINMFVQHPLFFLVLFFSAGFILAFGLITAGKGKGNHNPWHDVSFRILTAATAAQALAVLIIAKHYTDHYLLPVMSISGLILFSIFVYMQRMNYLNLSHIRKSVIFLCLLVMIVSAWRIAGIKNVMVQNLQIKDEALVIQQIMDHEYKNDFKIISIPHTSLIGSLVFGKFFINNNELFSETLQNIYGEIYFYNFFNGKFHTWTKEFFIEDMISEGQKDNIVLNIPLLRDGDKLTCDSGSVLYLKDVFGGRYQTIFVIRKISGGTGKFQQIPVSPYLQ